MKIRKILFIIAVILFCSCNNAIPEEYFDEINDSVRGIIAMSNFELSEKVTALDLGIKVAGSVLADLGMPALKEIDSAMKEDDLFDRVSKLVEESVSYGDAFAVLSQDGNPYISNGAKALSAFYSDYSPVIGECEMMVNNMTGKKWSFCEEKSGVQFFFELTNLDSSRPQWRCMAEQRSLEKYVSKTLKGVLESDQSSALTNIVESVVGRLSNGI